MEDQNTPNVIMRNEGSIGPVIGTIIILAVILLGGLYFWGNRGNNMYEDENSSTDAELQAIQNQSSSDESAAIEADLNNTRVDYDSQLNAS